MIRYFGMFHLLAVNKNMETPQDCSIPTDRNGPSIVECTNVRMDLKIFIYAFHHPPSS